jgi:hypothetical protein
MRPDGLTDEQFQEQLKGFDLEINNWKKYLEKKLILLLYDWG